MLFGLPSDNRAGIGGCLAVAMLLLVTGASSFVCAGEPSADDLELFEKKIRPLLVEHCYGCHNAEKHKGNLRLDSSAAWLVGGDSGPALVPGKPDDSLLIQAVRYESLEMPPDGKLSLEKIALLEQW